ncbi:MAG: 4'-phosphopantetheinyl transferase superfamily protein [Chromatiaceae bacterium]|nr:4'-phosphopantetheinyl transferase superfamily protein [Chromatiaceae bacterium]MBP8197271.1 4'-phosphopantetheinyl transferase superfamily protein [Chromatiaceae bacterium]MBP8282715.1 4'-phosphopantetheinyl transferase superfamily protein [Chromatiaceae bacterium]
MLALTTLPWVAASPAPLLGHRDLQIWIIPCDAENGDPEALWPLLSGAEQARADRRLAPGHRAAYIRAHAGLRLILATHLATPPARIAFQQGPQGKPAVAGPLKFNLTTSGDLALVALRWDQAVGIDCERPTANRNLLGIARRLFSPAEVELLLAASEAERPALFIRFWTALEASVKLEGRGLFQPAEADSPQPEIIHFSPQPGYVAALASREPPPLASWMVRRLLFPG